MQNQNHDVVYQAIGKIREIVFLLVKRNKNLWLEERRDSPNPYYSQTKTGLFLELYYGLPNTLWTPWGKYKIGGSGSGSGNEWGLVVSELCDRFGAILVVEKRYVNGPFGGEYGPIYSLSKVDDLILPPAKALSRDLFVEYGESKRQWQDMEDRLGKF